MELQIFLPFLLMITVIQLSFLPTSLSEPIPVINNQSDTLNLGSGLNSAALVKSRVAPIVAFEIVSGVIGIVGTVLTTFGIGWSFGTSPKATTDDIMKELKNDFGKLNTKIDTKFKILDSNIANLASGISSLRSDMISGFNAMDLQFVTVHKELETIYQTLQKIELGKYSDVEIAVQGALTDIRYNNTLDLIRRATTLCDQLNFYMGGLLGTNRFATDILNLTVSQVEVSVCSFYFIFCQLNFYFNT